MKRLNKKGFTLVELLAVIVILAIVVGITLVTILPTLENSRVKAFETAVESIRDYIQSQREMALLSSDLQGETYVSEVGTATCTLESKCSNTVSGKDILALTGYSDNIDKFSWYVENGIVKIDCANVKEGGDYSQKDSAINECTAS